MSDDRTHHQPDSDNADLGPEPDWLTDDVVETDAAPSPQPEPEIPTASSPPEPSDQRDAESESQTVEFVPVAPTERQERKRRFWQRTHQEEPVESSAVARTSTAAQAPAGARPDRPWLWGAVPFVFLIALGLVTWIANSQTLNSMTTWRIGLIEQPPLLPNRWALMIWWPVVALIAVFLIYGMTPRGRLVTHIKLTGPLITIALAAGIGWMAAWHWRENQYAVIAISIVWAAIAASYLVVLLGVRTSGRVARMLAAIPMSAAASLSTFIAVITWQSYTSAPFGERGTSLLILLGLVILAAILTFFLRDGIFPIVQTILLLGVAQRQWGHDTVISLSAILSVVFTVALAAMGWILSMESSSPAMTTDVPSRRGRLSFNRIRRPATETRTEPEP